MNAAAKSRTSKSPTQARRARLLALLATGEFHSGERLAKRLRISRGGIWKLIRSLQAMGVNIESVPRQGYRFPRAIDLLDRNAILAEMSPEIRELLSPLDVLLTVDSTNRYVAEHAANAPVRRTFASRRSRMPAAAGAGAAGSRLSAAASACRSAGSSSTRRRRSRP